MRIRFSAFSLLCAVVSGCAPEPKCGGALYSDPASTNCRPCPKDSTFKNGTCVCKDPYEFVNNRCELMDGAVIETPDTGPASSVAATCGDYCDFVNVCIGTNAIAQAALKDIVTGLHADDTDTAACESSCKSDTGGDGSSDPVVACIEAGRMAAACAGDSTQTGLGGAIKLLGDCCRPNKIDMLCMSICKVLTSNALVKDQIDFCK
jgi:hypothetical protein